MPYIPIRGFAPDADPTQPGVLTFCQLLIPTLNGMRALPGDAQASSAVASAVASAVSLTKLDGTIRVLAATQGTTSKIYELGTNDWTDRTDGTTYTATANVQWTFAQYRDIVLAVQPGHTLLKSDASNTFTNVTARAPKARIVEVVLDFAMLFNIDDTSAISSNTSTASTGFANIYGKQEDRWICSAAGDIDSWTADIATQATSGRLTDYPGEITAAKRLGSDIIVFKRRSMFLGRYVGSPQVWSFVAVPGEGLGTWGPGGVVSIESALLFWGYDNFYLFDGTRPVPIGTNRVADFATSDLDQEFAERVVGFHDRQNWRVYWWYASNRGLGTGALDAFLCYNYRSDRWGRGDKLVRTAFEFLEPGITYDELGDFFDTYDDLPTSTYDGAFQATGTFKPATVDTSDQIQKLEGVPTESAYTTGDIGKDGITQLVTRVRPRFKTAPSSGTQSHFSTDTEGSANSTVRATTGMRRGAFDHVWSARWHRFTHSYAQVDMELLGIDIEMQPDGLE